MRSRVAILNHPQSAPRKLAALVGAIVRDRSRAEGILINLAAEDQVTFDASTRRRFRY